MSNRMLLIIIAVVIVLGTIVLLFSGITTNLSTEIPQTVSPTVSLSPTSSEMIVTETSAGFEPQSLTVRVGTKVTWKNNSGDTISINSDPHPQHTTYPPLNLGLINDGSSGSLIFDKPGTYGYHDHLQPGRKGTIIVE